MHVPVEKIEAAVIRHYSSLAGDPHRHLRLQINARVWAAAGEWRGIHSVGVRDSIEAINGIGHAAVVADPEFRSVSVHSHDALHAELITEGVYLAAWVAAPQFDSAKTPPDSWLWSIAVETAAWQAVITLVRV